LLGHGIDDAALASVFGPYLSAVDRSDFTAYCACKEIGVSVAFKKGAGLGANGPLADTHLVNAFHLYGPNDAGYRQYDKPLPAGLSFGDREETFVGKLGTPSASGGGKFSAMQKKMLPRWVRFAGTGNTVIHLQLSLSGGLELVTLIVEKV